MCFCPVIFGTHVRSVTIDKTLCDGERCLHTTRFFTNTDIESMSFENSRYIGFICDMELSTYPLRLKGMPLLVMTWHDWAVDLNQNWGVWKIIRILKVISILKFPIVQTIHLISLLYIIVQACRSNETVGQGCGSLMVQMRNLCKPWRRIITPKFPIWIS